MCRDPFSVASWQCSLEDEGIFKAAVGVPWGARTAPSVDALEQQVQRWRQGGLQAHPCDVGMCLRASVG